MKILVLPGDGIGPEITQATLKVLEAARARFRLELELVHDVVGHESYRLHGTTVRDVLLEQAKRADGLILGWPVSTSTTKARARSTLQVLRKGLDLW